MRQARRAAPGRLGYRRRSRGDAQLVEDVRDVPMNRVVAQEETFGDCLVVQAFSDEAEDLELARGQAGGSRGVGRRRRVERRGQRVEERARLADVERRLQLGQQIDDFVAPPGSPRLCGPGRTVPEPSESACTRARRGRRSAEIDRSRLRNAAWPRRTIPTPSQPFRRRGWLSPEAARS